MRPYRQAQRLDDHDSCISEAFSPTWAVREAVPAGPQGLRRQAPWLAIGRVLAGQAHTVTGTTYNQGDVFIIPTGTRLGKEVARGGLESEYLVVKGLGVDRLEAHLPAGQVTTWARPRRPLLTLLGDIINEGLNQNSGWEWRFSAGLLRLFGQIIQDSQQHAARLSDRIRLLIAEQPDDAWDVDRLARALHASPSSLHHRFKDETGHSLMSWVRKLRMQRAGELLKRHMSITAVAEQMNFSSPYQLSRQFSAIMGTSPSKWRQQQGSRQGREPFY